MSPTDIAANAHPASRPGNDLLEGQRLLQTVQDYVFSFDDPAFYWFCRHVKLDQIGHTYDIAESDRATAWRLLLERPDDYRGTQVVIEGRLLTHSAYVLPNRRDVGRLYQCEIGIPNTRAICTVVCIDDPGDLPIRTAVRAKGFFIKIRSYRTMNNKTNAGPLLVARRIEAAGPILPPYNEAQWDGNDSFTWLVGGTAILAILWWWVRRSLRTAMDQKGEHPPKREQPTNSEDDFAWLIQEEDRN